MSEKKENIFVRLGKTLWRWCKRMFLGASKELSDEEIFAVEALESPSRLAVKTFFRRKLAVAALVILVALFLFVFIGSALIPIDVNFEDANQANIAPLYSMRNVPGGLKNDIVNIGGYSNFTLGVDSKHNLYVWGSSRDALSRADFKNYPDILKNGNVYMAAAGADHCIAVTMDGKLVGCYNIDELNEHSIVDLMKLLDLDSSLAARKELAKELHYTGDTGNSAEMNIWLHKQVMAKLEENGGIVPDSLKS